MRVVTVSGTRGSGRTSLIRELVGRISALGQRCAVIVNEDGDVDYDEPFVRTHDLCVEKLRGG